LTGFVEGQNVAVEYRWAEGGYDRLPALAVDLVVRKVDATVAFAASLRHSQPKVDPENRPGNRNASRYVRPWRWPGLPPDR